MRGKLIVLEGLDRAGKTTQCGRLIQHLQDQGHTVKAQRFPDRTTAIGCLIDSYLKGTTEADDHVIHLLFSANRWEAAAQIRREIDGGVTVVLDRYVYSGIVYSAAKHNPSLSLSWARKPDEGLPRPDICVFLDISPEQAALRGGFGDEKYEKREMQDRVRELFLHLRKHSPDREDFVEIDGGRHADEVQQSIADAVAQVCNRVDQQALPLRSFEPWP